MKIKNKKVYLCKTEELSNEFLQECEKQGIRWLNDKRPTEYNYWRDEKGKIFYMVSDNHITYDYILRDEKRKELGCAIKYMGNVIVIKNIGDEVFAYRGGKKGIAKCSPDDEFDFYTGAKLALDRLFDKDKAKEKFIPHLMCGSRHYGIIGTPTKYKDAIGRPLVVGDTVEHFSATNESYGETTIVETEEDGQFVMGICDSCDGKTGKIKDGWKIIKKRDHAEVNAGEDVNLIKYVKTEKQVRKE